MANERAKHLQLLIKNVSCTEIYGSDCIFEDGTATLRFNCQELLEHIALYDLCLTWYGTTIMDLPKIC